MKLIIFLILGVALLMFYQTNPLATLIIVILFISLYMFSKRKKNGKKSGIRNSLLMKQIGSSSSLTTDLLLLSSFQQSNYNLLNKQNNLFEFDDEDNEQFEQDIERIKRKLIDILD